MPRLSGKFEVTQIYKLRDPDDTSLVYIGTSAEPRKRIVSHMSNARQIGIRITEGWLPASVSPKNYWLMSLIVDGRRPLLMVLGEYLNQEAYRAEQDFIDAALSAGEKVLNTKRGKGMPPVPSFLDTSDFVERFSNKRYEFINSYVLRPSYVR